MAILKNGGGTFSLDDRMGWRWSGDDDAFLLGILRVGGSSVADEFYEELESSDVTKADMKRAIRHSLAKDPKDGLYALIGDNNAYMGYDNSAIDSRYSDQQYEIENCLEKNFYEKQKAHKVADEIVDKSFSDMPSNKDVFEEYENELTKNYDGKKSWKQFVESKIIKGCDYHEKATEFMKCVRESLEQEQEGIREGFFEKFDEAIYSAMKISDDDLKEIAEQHEIPYKVVEHCAHGGYDTLEEFRPISEKQLFLESLRANVKERKSQDI